MKLYQSRECPPSGHKGECASKLGGGDDVGEGWQATLAGQHTQLEQGQQHVAHVGQHEENVPQHLQGRKGEDSTVAREEEEHTYYKIWRGWKASSYSVW